MDIYKSNLYKPLTYTRDSSFNTPDIVIYGDIEHSVDNSPKIYKTNGNNYVAYCNFIYINKSKEDQTIYLNIFNTSNLRMGFSDIKFINFQIIKIG
jgi:hypothetical protein